MTSLIAFDYGTRRIGVAVGQTITQTARELATLTSTDGQPDWDAIETLIDDWAPDLLLVGLPLDANGEDTPQTAIVRRFAAELAEYDLPVQLIDEHLTSNEASDMLRTQRQRGSRRKRVKKVDVDALSAVIIAEQWLRQRDIARS
ncbi:MAG: Holliday junction resolvase RuvX [Woeseiaceae bacterium]